MSEAAEKEQTREYDISKLKITFVDKLYLESVGISHKSNHPRDDVIISLLPDKKYFLKVFGACKSSNTPQYTYPMARTEIKEVLEGVADAGENLLRLQIFVAQEDNKKTTPRPVRRKVQEPKKDKVPIRGGLDSLRWQY